MKLLDEGTPLGGRIGEGGGFGTINNSFPASGGEALKLVTSIISKVIGVMTIAAAIWFFFQLLTAGIAWISAGGEKNKLTEARDRLTHAFIGLVIVVAGWAILALASQFFGYDLTISSPQTVIDQLKFK